MNEKEKLRSAMDAQFGTSRHLTLRGPLLFNWWSFDVEGKSVNPYADDYVGPAKFVGTLIAFAATEEGEVHIILTYSVDMNVKSPGAQMMHRQCYFQSEGEAPLHLQFEHWVGACNFGDELRVAFSPHINKILRALE